MKTTALIIITACTLVSSVAMAEVGATASASASESESADAPDSTDVAQNRTYLDVIASLEAEGYMINEVTTTWLGRIVVLAQSAQNLREVVVSNATGEIMSDIILVVYATGAASGTAAVDTAGIGGTVGVDIGLGSDESGANGSASGSVSVGIGLGN